MVAQLCAGVGVGWEAEGLLFSPSLPRVPEMDGFHVTHLGWALGSSLKNPKSALKAGFRDGFMRVRDLTNNTVYSKGV